jgi:hypothetical protein
VTLENPKWTSVHHSLQNKTFEFSHLAARNLAAFEREIQRARRETIDDRFKDRRALPGWAGLDLVGSGCAVRSGDVARRLDALTQLARYRSAEPVVDRANLFLMRDASCSGGSTQRTM